MGKESGKLTLFDKYVFETFIPPGEVVEIRVPHFYGKLPNGERHKGNLSGYFDEHEPFCEAVRMIEKNVHDGNYFTLQVIDPRLLARAYNRMKPGIAATSDPDVIALRWLPIDIDPVRPSGISSSDSELQEAYDVREQVISWIADNLNFTNPTKAMSGNGYHLLYRLPDMPVNPENTSLIKSVLVTLDKEFSNDHVNIDLTVFNPARVWKLYGTKTGKGDELPANQYREARPHRMSYIEDMGGCQ